MCALRKAELALAEEPVRVLRLPSGAAAKLSMGKESNWKENHVRRDFTAHKSFFSLIRTTAAPAAAAT